MFAIKSQVLKYKGNNITTLKRSKRKITSIFLKIIKYAVFWTLNSTIKINWMRQKPDNNKRLMVIAYMKPWNTKYDLLLRNNNKRW